MSLPSADYIRSRLDYDPDTGIFVWKRKPELSRYDHAWNKKHAGKPAGSIVHVGPGRKPYGYLTIDNMKYRSHRVAWLWVTGEWPAQEIDHTDNNSINNRFSNLRQATRSENQCNARRPARNTSGFKGASLCKERGRWVAMIKKNGKQRNLGRFDTLEEATEAYRKAALELHGEFARFE